MNLKCIDSQRMWHNLRNDSQGHNNGLQGELRTRINYSLMLGLSDNKTEFMLVTLTGTTHLNSPPISIIIGHTQIFLSFLYIRLLSYYD